MKWSEGKPYYSLNQYYRERFGEKTYKLALDIGATCPNRDGTLSDKGCIYCSELGSGDYAAGMNASIADQINEAITLVSDKYKGHTYIAYLQSFTNTYGSTETILSRFSQILSDPRISGLAIATRPDCLEEDLLVALSTLNRSKPIWVELGLQSIHKTSADYINRCYPLSVFEEAVRRLNCHQIPVVVHLIAGLPTETSAQFIESVTYLNHLPIEGIKFHLLHVLKGTRLGLEYSQNPFTLPTMEIYCDLIAESIGCLRPDIVIHRLTGDGPKELLLAPRWSLDKRRVLNRIHKVLKDKDIWQGKYYNPQEALYDRQ